MSLPTFVGHHLKTTLLRGCLSACVTLALVGSPALHAQTAEMVGVHYEPTVRADGKELTLNGTGVAYRAMVKLYAVGLYLPGKAHQTAEVLGQSGAKQLRFVMLRSMRVDELGKLITRGIETNCSRQDFFGLIPAIRTMGEQFSHIQRLNAQDVFTIAYAPDQGTSFLINGTPVDTPIKDPGFFPAILKVWLGDRPTTSDLKNALLDHKALPVLSALE